MKVRIKSVPKFANGGNLSPAKAKIMLEENQAGGKKLTRKQQKYFGYLASKAKGGKTLEPTSQEGLLVEDGKYKQLAPDSIELTGDRHSQGGQQISFGGKSVEAEGSEVVQATPDENGNTEMVVLGNMEVPGTKKTFKQVAKDLNDKEGQAREFEQKGTDLVLDTDPTNSKWDQLKFNSGEVMMKGGHQKVEQLRENKETLAQTQQALLDIADENGLDPEKLSRGEVELSGNKPIKAENGDTLDKAPDGATLEAIKAQAVEAANAAGVDPNVFLNLIQAESDFNPNSTGTSKYGTARGLVQLMPDEAKKYGLTTAQLTSNKPEDIQKVLQAGASQLADLTKEYNGDSQLALAAYNGGPGAVDYVKKQLGKDNITGQDWVNFMAQKRQNDPSTDKSAWQNETYNYVTKITGGTDQDRQNFNKNYYKAPEVPVDYSTIPKVETPEITSNQPEQVPTQPAPQQPAAPMNFNTFMQSKRNIPPSNAEMLNPVQILPELIGLKNNVQEPVFQQDYEPQLYEPYRVSFQDRINENNRQLNALKQSSYFANNPQALSVLAGQTYNANNQVLADEFRTNQSISNEVTNKNVSLLNEAQQTNLKLQDQAFVRQTAAHARTQETNQLLISSIVDKVMKQQLENRQLRALEATTDYRYGPNGQLTNYSGVNPADEINWGSLGNLPSSGQVIKEVYGPNNKLKTKTITKKQK